MPEAPNSQKRSSNLDPPLRLEEEDTKKLDHFQIPRCPDNAKNPRAEGGAESVRERKLLLGLDAEVAPELQEAGPILWREARAS